MKILPINMPDGCDIGIREVSVTYVQRGDCLQSADEDQTLTLTAMADFTEVKEDGSVDGWFYRLSTDTHWSFNSPDEIKRLVEDFEKRLLQEYKATQAINKSGL